MLVVKAEFHSYQHSMLFRTFLVSITLLYSYRLIAGYSLTTVIGTAGMIAIIDVDTADYEISPALSPHPTNHISYGPCATSAAGSAAVQQSVYTTPAVALSISISTRSVQLAEDQARQKANQDQLDISRLPENANLEYCSSINVLNNEGQTLAVPSPTQQSLTPEVSTRVPSALSVNGGSSCGTVGGVGSGDVTIYNDQGYGACGWENDTNSEDFFALAGRMLPLSIPSL